jgi:hypothetical protein
MPDPRYKGKRITVTVPEGTWEVIETNLKGVMGDKDAEILRNIIISWLVEHGFIKKKEVGKEEKNN